MRTELAHDCSGFSLLGIASLRFQPTKRPQLAAQKPKSKAPLPKSTPPAIQQIGAVPDAPSTVSRLAAKSTLADWTAGDDDDVNGFYGGEKRQRGGRKKRKKNKEESHVPQNWDDIYDPSRPNSYEEYKHSDEKIREVREWKDRLYAHRMARRRSSYSDSEDESRPRPQINSGSLRPKMVDFPDLAQINLRLYPCHLLHRLISTKLRSPKFTRSLLQFPTTLRAMMPMHDVFVYRKCRIQIDRLINLQRLFHQQLIKRPLLRHRHHLLQSPHSQASLLHPLLQFLINHHRLPSHGHLSDTTSRPHHQTYQNQKPSSKVSYNKKRRRKKKKTTDPQTLPHDLSAPAKKVSQNALCPNTAGQKAPGSVRAALES